MRLFLSAGIAATLCAPVLAQDGLTLFQPFSGTTTYLVNGSGMVVNSWPGTTTPGLSVYLLPDGDMIRTRNLVGGGGGTGGGLQRMSYDGQVEWTFSFFNATLTPHHDIEVLPNGNVLMVVWEEVGGTEAIAQGRDPSNVGATFTPDAVYEIEPAGSNMGSVVWEWHAWDHLVQDFDSSKPNFGVIADHPELIDLNYGPTGDWLHVNGIDYHPGFDQIAISVPNFDEIWVIDHSTTTEEAAGHSGGNSGKGGDLLYRWGNPRAYDRGTIADQVFYFLHDVQWIEPGRPGAGNMTVFNNGNSRPTGNWSSADEWTPPVDASGNYTLNAGMAYGPAALSWQYSDPGSFHSQIMGGAERLENGNTLICDATAGRMFEVTDSGTTTWSYTNPFGGLNWVFKATRYADCDSNDVFDGDQIASGAGDDLDGNGVLDVCEPPTNYCDATANSTGMPASMSWAGTTSIAANDLDLIAVQCPANQNGIFAYGPNRGTIPLGDGTLCLRAPIVRLPLLMTNGTGTATFDFDNQNLPASSPPLTPGTVWNFTFWFRDPAGAGAGSNLSDGLTVLFGN